MAGTIIGLLMIVIVIEKGQEMLDVNEMQRMLEDRWTLNGFTKLEKPEVADPLYVAMKSPPEDDADSFDFLYWEPASQALEESVAKEDKGQYYDVLVYYEDDTLCMISSRGKVEPNMLKDQV